MSQKSVAILMLTYNAPRYVFESIWGVKKKTDCTDFECRLIVVDNRSRLPTRILVWALRLFGFIDKLYLNKSNSLFAGGNNIAASMVDKNTDLLLLLNSDIRIEKADWLQNLMSKHKKGVTAYGLVENPRRADGYCYLIDHDLYKKYPLDENYQWWWSITLQQAMILNEASIQAYSKHERWLHHYGGKSGKGYKDAKGMDVNLEEVKKWFKKGNTVKILR